MEDLETAPEEVLVFKANYVKQMELAQEVILLQHIIKLLKSLMHPYQLQLIIIIVINI